MNFVQDIINICNENKNKKIGMFIDMDGVIADYDINGYTAIRDNKLNAFFNKRPIHTTINILKRLKDIDNLELYILSACLFKNQAEDKSMWLDKYAPFIKNENRYFIVKEIVKYNNETKPEIKVNYIVDIMNKDKLDLAIYIEDEHSMLRKAKEILGNKVIRYHISSLID